MKQEDLKRLSPLIAREHPRTDLNPVHQIKLYIYEESRRKRDVTAREIWREMRNYPKRIVDNSVKWLFKHGYIKRIRKGSGFFFCEEKKNGNFGESYFTREEIDQVKIEKAEKVLDILRRTQRHSQENFKTQYRKLVSTTRRGNPDLNSYNKIIEMLWAQGFPGLVKLFFKSGAYRYAK